MRNRLVPILLLFAVFSACVQIQPTPDPIQLTKSALTQSPPTNWWTDAAFYEIFVRSFYDIDGNGIGDFNGIRQKLDYLEELGITAIWLMPINPSPSYHGYDVTNYYNVNSDYGSMDDFKNLLNETHKRDIRIIIDLVLNHTSREHPFFVEANRDPNSSYRDWYIWSDKDQGNYWHNGSQDFYYGFFWEGMPDLNYRNADVTSQMFNVARFWLEEVGVDGFRIDAAKHLIEEGNKVENTNATHEWYKGFYTYYKAKNPNAYTVGEVYGAGAFLANTYHHQLDQIFNFELAGGMMNSINSGSNTGINSAWKFTLKEMDTGNYATFLTNHDQNRVMSVFNGNIDKAKLAAFLLLTSPGTPFIYYGEEIGMTGEKPDEDIRLPMQWTVTTNAGFTEGSPWRAPNANYTAVNVATQENDPNSLLSLYRNLISLRNQHSALQTGSLVMLDADNSNLYANLRANETEMILVVVNLSDTAISNYNLTLRDAVIKPGAYSLSPLFGEGSFTSLQVDPDGKFKDFKLLAELPPYGKYILGLTPAK
jgi:glycosidase